MRSAELARLAGTTVRTLRHYHQIGLLDEPHRSAGGYRDYGLEHLVRVLGVRRLAALGLSLDAVAETFDGPRDRRDHLLDELDAELAERIEQLQRRRDAVAIVRSAAGDPTLPPASAGYLARLEAAGADPAAIEDEKALLLMLGHGLGDAAERLFAAIEESMLDPQRVAASLDLLIRFRRADPADEDALVEELFAEAVQLVRSLTAEVSDAPGAGDADELFEIFRAERLTPVQDRVLRRVEARLHAP